MSLALLTAIMLVSAVGLWAIALGLVRYGATKALAPAAQRRVSIQFGVATAAWLLGAVLLAYLGVFDARHAIVVPPIAFGATLPLALGLLAINRWRALAVAAHSVPRAWVIGVQVYRALGVIFLVLLSQERLPAVFAVPAGVGDVAIGVTAPIVAVLVLRRAPYGCLAALAWNVLGILDLVAAVALGFLSSPGAFQALAFGSPNTLITQYPLVLIPLFHVPLSMLLHVVSLQQLRTSRVARDGRPEAVQARCPVGRGRLTTACS